MFSGCSGLVSASIPKSVTSIGEGAFDGCERLTAITIPDGVKRIGYEAFWGCSSLTNLVIPGSVTEIGDMCFAYCGALLLDVCPDNENYQSLNGMLLTKDGATLLRGTKGGVVFPDSVMEIANYAFSGCNGLMSVTIPSRISSIGYGTFANCTGLETLVIPGTVTTIANDAFCGCSDLTSVIISNGVQHIGSYAFAYCTSLTSIVIPNSVESIGVGAFAACDALKTATIPQCVCDVASAYSAASSPSYLWYDNSGLGTIFGCSFSSLTNNIPSLPALTNLVVAEGVTRIVDSAFANCPYLQSVTIPASVTRIGDNAFMDCTALETLVFEGDAPDVGSSILLGTPRRLGVVVQPGSVGWSSGAAATGLPNSWCDRGIAYSDGSSGSGTGGGSSGGSGGGSSDGGTVIVTNDCSYALTDHAADRAIASVTVDEDCAIDEFVLKDGKVYDCVLRIVNTAEREVTLTLPAGYEYEAFKGATPLRIPASSRNIITITRTSDRTFLVSREELETVQ